jgi:hypothetical protein
VPATSIGWLTRLSFGIKHTAYWPLLITHTKPATNMIRTYRRLDNFRNKPNREVTAARIALPVAWNCCNATKNCLSEDFHIMERNSLGNLGRIEGPNEVSCEVPLVSATTSSRGQ